MRSSSSVSAYHHHHHNALNSGTSDEELLCASLMKNSREIKAYFNTFSERNWIKLLQYLVLIGIRTVNKRNGPYSSLENIRDIAESLNTSNNSQQQSQQQPYNDQRQSYNSNINNNNNNGANNNNGFNNNNRQQQPIQSNQQQEYIDDNYENDEARFKPSSRWRKGERQGVNFKGNNNQQQYLNRDSDYLTEKPNNMIPSSPNKGQQQSNNNNNNNNMAMMNNRNQSSYQQPQQQQNNYNNNNPYSNSYDDSPTFRPQPQPQQQFYDQQRPPYYNNTPSHQQQQQQAIPNVHDYFNPYPNTQHAYHQPTFSPQPTFVHYPSYPSHPLSSPVIHHHINPPQPHIPQQSQPIYIQAQQQPIQSNQQQSQATFNASPPPISSYSNSQAPSQATTPRGRADSDVNEQPLNIPKSRPQKLTIPIEEEPIVQEEENPKSIAWSTTMTSPAKKKKGVTPKKDQVPKKTPLKKQSSRHSSVPPKFGIPYNLNRIESKIKDQIQMDKKTHPHKGNFEPVLVTSKNEETAIRDEGNFDSSDFVDPSDISKIASPVKPPLPREKPIYDEETPQQDNVSNFVVSKPPRLARHASIPTPKQQEPIVPQQNPVKPNIVTNQTPTYPQNSYVPQYSNSRPSSQQNVMQRANPQPTLERVPERIPERPKPIVTPIPIVEKLNQERMVPERTKPMMEVSRSDPIRQSQPQTSSYSQQFQQQQFKTPVRNTPSKRLEELLYQKSKPIESPREQKGSVLSIVENFMLDPNMKDFF